MSMTWRLAYASLCLHAQMMRLSCFRILVVSVVPMAASFRSDLPVALSCSQLLSLTLSDERRPRLLIDLRSRHRFRRGHIAGSHSIPSGLLLSGEPPEGELILISEAPGEAVDVIEALHAAGYHQRLHYLAEGLVGWRGQGLPIQEDGQLRPSPLSHGLLPALVGTVLLVAAALLSSLPLLGLGTLMVWGAWIEPSLPRHPRRQRLI